MEEKKSERKRYAYYRMAKDAGINMSDCELLMDGARAHFMTKRFDRIGNKKVHYQSLCAMDHADYKMPGHCSYEQLFSLMRSMRLSRGQSADTGIVQKDGIQHCRPQSR